MPLTEPVLMRTRAQVFNEMIWYPSHGNAKNSQVSVRPHFCTGGCLRLWLAATLHVDACMQVRVLDHLLFMNSKTLFKVRMRMCCTRARDTETRALCPVPTQGPGGQEQAARDGAHQLPSGQGARLRAIRTGLPIKMTCTTRSGTA